MADPLWLLLDADDTLWENNIFFEEAIAEFTAYVDHSELTPSDVREESDRVETCDIKSDGYGSEDSTINLVERYESLRNRPATTRGRRRLHGMSGRTAFARLGLLPSSGLERPWIRFPTV